MHRRHLAFALLLLLLPLALWLGARGLRGTAPPRHAKPELDHAAAPSAEPKALKPTIQIPSPLDSDQKNPESQSARSLRGTDIDGALRVGKDGSLVVGPDLLRLFDYFFTASGEESDEAIAQKIRALLRERLQEPAAGQAQALLDQYLRYRKDAEGIKLPKDEEADPTKRLEALKKLRKNVFGEENAQKMFGDEEIEGEIAIEEKKIREDNRLSEEERAAKIAELEAKLPESVKAARNASTLPYRAGREVLAMRERGASEEEINQYRTETLGEDAAERLAALDKERAAWKARMEEFEKKRARLAEQWTEQEAFKKAEQALLDEMFSPMEQRRVRATLAMQER